MGLLTETNQQYYAGQQIITATAAQTTFVWTGDTILVGTTSTTNTNVEVYVDTGAGYVKYTEVIPPAPIGAAQYSVGVNNNTISVVALGAGDKVKIQLTTLAMEANYGGYEYISMADVINNFLVAYVGAGKLIPHVKRTDVMFHAKRGLQEFSYDTLRSIKSQELTIPDSLSVIIPQDYVNYVQMSWIDDFGVKHIIYPTTLTGNPYEIPVPNSDGSGIPTQNSLGENEQGPSIIEQRWDTANDKLISGNIDLDFYNANILGWTWDKVAYGQRYGLEPETSQKNGWFTINYREGKFSFSSNLKGRLILLEYVSDGLSVDYDMRIPKMAEEAIYMHIAYSILAGRVNVPEYVVRRYKVDRRAALRNAKIRLSNIKLEEFTQIMRGKSKWIKH
tara:strand:- start:717 stop:1889 length:1173 start_codon:yes stop_codon:yes gene_type:complete